MTIIYYTIKLFFCKQISEILTCIFCRTLVKKQQPFATVYTICFCYNSTCKLSERIYAYEGICRYDFFCKFPGRFGNTDYTYKAVPSENSFCKAFIIRLPWGHAGSVRFCPLFQNTFNSPRKAFNAFFYDLGGILPM